VNARLDPAVAAVPPDALAWARAQRLTTRRTLSELLEERLDCPPQELIAQTAAAMGMRVIGYPELAALRPAFDAVPFVEASRRRCVAVRTEDDDLIVVLGDPYDADVHDWLEAAIDEPFSYAIAHRADVAAYLARHEASLRAVDAAVAGVPGAGTAAQPDAEISLEAISTSESVVVRLVDSTLFDAFRSNASDIHLETSADGLAIKYRIDGVLSAVEQVQGAAIAEQVISRVKVMAELDIAERRVPQDGRFKTRMKARDVDVRVSIMPSSFGEDAVLRILDRRAIISDSNALSLEQLGFSPDILRGLRDLASQPYGMLLVTGPTGSGKTTTIYGVLSEVNLGLDKIVTIEDPVEYRLPGVLQIPVNEKKGLTFARGLRSILRHDPDRIMVGEIRDPETAEIAVQSALTGHLVYTTVHANNVYDVIGRFMHMGIDLYNFVSAVNGVVAQRLVRVNCAQCALAQVPDESVLQKSRLAVAAAASFRFRRGAGCTACRGSGFRGRKAIAELLLMDDEIRELIVSRAPVRKIKEAAQSRGTRSLREAALDLVRAGETTLDEINRVTFVA
jgi:general secretion pathway protein E